MIKARLAADEVDGLSITLAPQLVGGGARLFGAVLLVRRWRPHSSLVSKCVRELGYGRFDG